MNQWLFNFSATTGHSFINENFCILKELYRWNSNNVGNFRLPTTFTKSNSCSSLAFSWCIFKVSQHLTAEVNEYFCTDPIKSLDISLDSMFFLHFYYFSTLYINTGYRIKEEYNVSCLEMWRLPASRLGILAWTNIK